MKVLSLDIGNGFGYVSLLDSEKSDPVPMFPQQTQLESEGGMPTTAYVTPPEGNPIVVYDLENLQKADKKYARKSSNLVREAKSKLHSGTINIKDISEPIPVEDVFSAIARDLIILANTKLRERGQDPIYDVIFTFPASYADTQVLEQMQRAIEKIQIDGHKIKVVDRLPEPAAVAVDYLYFMQNLVAEQERITKEEYTVLVYDLGHGTVDIAVVTANMNNREKPYYLHRKAGLNELALNGELSDVGGRNFDWALRDEILDILRKEGVSITPVIENDALELAQKMKHQLTSSDISVMNFERADIDISITRERFEEISEYLLEKTLFLTEDVLSDAEEAGVHIDAIILSGGASKMPMVRKGLEKLINGRIPIKPHRYSEAVSFGAARYAFWKYNDVGDKSSNPTIMIQSTDCRYGILQEDDQGSFLRVLAEKGVQRPYTSEEIQFRPDVNRPTVFVYKTSEKDKRVDISDCQSIIRIPFDVKKDTACTLKMTVNDDYSISITVHTPESKNIVKSSSDSVEKLVQ